jgi:glucose-6-phosphate isomerase
MSCDSDSAPTTKSITERGAWNAWVAHYQNVRELHLRKLFANDPIRGERMTVDAVGLDREFKETL